MTAFDGSCMTRESDAVVMASPSGEVIWTSDVAE